MVIGQTQFRTGRLQCLNAVAEPCAPAFSIRFHRACRASQDLCHCEVVREIIAAAYRYRFFRPLEGESALAAKYVQYGGIIQGDRQTERMRKLPRGGNGSLALHPGLFGIAENPT